MKLLKLKSIDREITVPMRVGSALISCEKKQGQAELKIKLSYSAAYGMGEKYNGLNQKGKRVINAVEEKFCHQGDKTYCSSPFFFTDTGFGLYIKTNLTTVFDFEDDITVLLPQDADIITFCGTPREIVSEYMSIFGQAKLPPKWAFGPFISANHWNSQAVTEKQLELLEKYKFPATVLVLEAWSDEATFYIFNGAKYTAKNGGEAFDYSDFDFKNSQWNDPKAMIEKLHKNGIHLVLWQVPVYKKLNADEPENRQNDNDRDFAEKNSLCVFRSNGEPYTIPEGKWFAGSMIPDFTNPETKKLWFSKRKYLLDIGVDGFKTDGGEFVYENDLSFFDGKPGGEMKNAYSQSYTKAYTEFVGDKRILFSRAGFSGQHTTPIHWAGDQQSENNELVSVLSAGLSAAMSGIVFWSFDIAGFAGKLPTLDLYRRATQMACFCPIMQWHSEPDGGQFGEFKDLPLSERKSNERSPWNLANVYNAPEFVDEMRFWHNLRMNLLPYIYSSAVYSSENSVPLIRPLAFEFYDDQKAVAVDDEFMLGESLLVAPMLEENSRSRTVYLPKGEWFGFFDKKSYKGGKSYLCSSDDKLPVFIRSGYGVALNLDDSNELGSGVGNSTDSYKNLCIFASGPKGEYSFKDNLNSDFTLSWEGADLQSHGEINTSFKVFFIK